MAGCEQRILVLHLHARLCRMSYCSLGLCLLLHLHLQCPPLQGVASDNPTETNALLGAAALWLTYWRVAKPFESSALLSLVEQVLSTTST